MDNFLFLAIFLVLEVIYAVQVFLGMGTAYRMTKTHGDNGISLYGYLIVFTLAAIIPGLGFYFWKKYRYLGSEDYNSYNNNDNMGNREI